MLLVSLCASTICLKTNNAQDEKWKNGFKSLKFNTFLNSFGQPLLLKAEKLDREGSKLEQLLLLLLWLCSGDWLFIHHGWQHNEFMFTQKMLNYKTVYLLSMDCINLLGRGGKKLLIPVPQHSFTDSVHFTNMQIVSIFIVLMLFLDWKTNS